MAKKTIFVIGMIIGAFTFFQMSKVHAFEIRPTFGSARAKLLIKIQERYPNARIEILGEIHWAGTAGPDAADFIEITQEGKGEARFTVKNSRESADGSVYFAAWMGAHIASKRIAPGEKLNPADFTLQELNVSKGEAYEYRGVILPSNTGLMGLESRQTILPGQFLTRNAVQKTPDLRRGDAVQIRFISGDLSVVTPGMAEEPAYLDDRVKVMAQKTKREFIGKLTETGVVEVKL
ncbi:MAG: flagellar basal body P-ring formation chaperone FlgA [Bdellovibrionota bacterium]